MNYFTLFAFIYFWNGIYTVPFVSTSIIRQKSSHVYPVLIWEEIKTTLFNFEPN